MDGGTAGRHMYTGDGWMERWVHGAVRRQHRSVPGCLGFLLCLKGHDPGWSVKTISTLILWGPGTIVDVSNLTRTPADTIRWFRYIIRSGPAPRPPAYMQNSHYHSPEV